MKQFYSFLLVLAFAGLVSAACPFNVWNPASWNCVGGASYELYGFDLLGACNNIAVTSSDPVLSGLTLKCDVVANAGAQSAAAKLTTGTSYEGTSVVVGRDVIIETQTIDQACVAPVTASSETVNNACFCGADSSGFCSNGLSSAQCSGVDSNGRVLRWVSGACYTWTACGNSFAQQRVDLSPKYRIGAVGTTSSIDWNVRAILKERDGTVLASCVVSPQTQTCSLASGGVVYGYAKWIGNLGSNVYCSHSYSTVLQPLAGGAWFNVDSYKLQNYRNAYSSLLSYGGSWSGGSGLWSSYVAAFNSLSGGASLTSSNLYRFSAQQQIVFPAITFYLKGEFLSLHVPAAQPSIVYVNPAPIWEGNQSKYSLILKNAGSERDCFDVSLVCPQPVTYTSNRVCLAAGLQGEAFVLTNPAAGGQTCSLKASSVGSPNLQDSRVALLEVLKQPCPFDCCPSNAVYAERGCLPSLTWTKTESTPIMRTVVSSCVSGAKDLGAGVKEVTACGVFNGNKVADVWRESSATVTSLFSCVDFKCQVTKTCWGATCSLDAPAYSPSPIPTSYGGQPIPSVEPQDCPLSFECCASVAGFKNRACSTQGFTCVQDSCVQTSYVEVIPEEAPYEVFIQEEGLPSWLWIAGAVLLLAGLGYYWFVKK